VIQNIGNTSRANAPEEGEPMEQRIQFALKPLKKLALSGAVPGIGYWAISIL
jgi:hypothetical protein